MTDLASDIRTGIKSRLEAEVTSAGLTDAVVFTGRPDPSRLARSRGVSVGAVQLAISPERLAAGQRGFELDWSCSVMVSSGRWHGSGEASFDAAWSLARLLFLALVRDSDRLGLASRGVLFVRPSSIDTVQSWADSDIDTDGETVLEVTIEVRTRGWFA